MSCTVVDGVKTACGPLRWRCGRHNMQLRFESTLTPVRNKGKGHKNNNKIGTLSPAWQCTKSSSLPITPQLYGRARATGAICTLYTCSPISVCTSVSFTRDTTLALSIVLTLEFPSLGYWLQLQQHFRMQNILTTASVEHKT
ncbi:hypothetical protein E2C01_031134 [Portunus trituberculatus]|uniref:Uncharacterized protein n=1 Tax=Portunus trituberculatus TaxID=210409 RepID=A0A5B7EWV2_PORTR|nr:hypothetical protein [Portunus trituberculatus]